jgi:hypothetical protein
MGLVDRLSLVTASTAHLATQMLELKRLRDQLRKAQHLSRKPRHISKRKKGAVSKQ